jgi:hypothetical protein
MTSKHADPLAIMWAADFPGLGHPQLLYWLASHGITHNQLTPRATTAPQPPPHGVRRSLT